MPHLISLHYPEAPSGSWSIVKFGTATPATAYSDFRCTLVKAGRSLSAVGRDKFYVDELVDVSVSTAAAVPVDSFTAGVDGESVVVSSDSFTGTDKVTALQVIGGQILLPDLMDKVNNSFGANDWMVRETGQAVDRNLKDALQDVRQANLPWFNVKASPYNATGLGAVNDANAIQAAINAAAAVNGGIVLVPRGTYLMTNGITITHPNVTLMGDGMGLTTLNYTSGVGYAISVNCGVVPPLLTGNGMHGFRLLSAGSAIQVTASAGFFVDEVWLTSTSLDAPGFVSITGSVDFRRNRVEASVTTLNRGTLELTNAAGDFWTISENKFSGAIASGFYIRNVTAGGNAIKAVISGNQIINNGLAALMRIEEATAVVSQFVFFGNVVPNNVMVLTAIGANYHRIVDAGNSLFSTNAAVSPLSAYLGEVVSLSRERSMTHTTGVVFTPQDAYKDNVIDVNGTPLTVNASGGFSWDGKEYVFRIRNTSGGAVVVNWNAAYLGTAAMGNIAAGQTRVVRFIRKETGTTPGWRYAGHVDTA